MIASRLTRLFYPCAHPRVVVLLCADVGEGLISRVDAPCCYHLIVVVRLGCFLDTCSIDLHSSLSCASIPHFTVHISSDTSPALGTLLVTLYILLQCYVILLFFHHFWQPERRLNDCDAGTVTSLGGRGFTRGCDPISGNILPECHAVRARVNHGHT